MSINIITGPTVVFPETAVAGDQMTKTVTVTGVTQPGDLNETGSLTVNFDGDTFSGAVPVTQQRPDIVPTFTITDSPGFDFEIVSAAPRPNTLADWNVTFVITKL